jgi:glycosyltransferase involved in cell wall biosynthesis
MQAETKKGLIIGPPPEKFLKTPRPGGVAVHIGGLIDFLEKENIETYMCYHRPCQTKTSRIVNSSKSEWFFAVVSGFFVLLVRKKTKLSLYTFKDIVILAYYITTLRKIMTTIKPDFIHVHHLHNPAPIALALLRYDKRIIVTNHGFSWFLNSSTSKKVYKMNLIYSITTSIICVSDSLCRETSKIFNKSEKLITLYNPTDFLKYPIKINNTDEQIKNAKKIFFNGYNQSRKIKGLDILLWTMNKYAELYDNIVLVILCDQEGERYIKGTEWNFDYELTGKISFNIVLRNYLEADMLVVPSAYESFGLIYSEALAVGIPVIGYHNTIDEIRGILTTYIGESFN